MSELFVPRNPVEVAQEFQYQIDFADPEEAPELAMNAKRVIGDVEEIYGSKELIIHTLGGFVIKPRIVIGEPVIDDTLGERIIEGDLVYLEYLQLQENPRIQTFTLLMNHVEATDISGGVPTRSSINSLVALPVLSITEVRAA